jgi:hypothetical protein
MPPHLTNPHNLKSSGGEKWPKPCMHIWIKKKKKKEILRIMYWPIVCQSLSPASFNIWSRVQCIANICWWNEWMNDQISCKKIWTGVEETGDIAQW